MHHVKESAAGFLMAAEVEYLGKALHAPERPFVAILGGAKVSDKLEVIENLLGKVDALIIGGAMAYTFLKAQGLPVGKSLVEEDLRGDGEGARAARAKARGITFELPIDHVVADKLDASAPAETLTVGDPAIGDRMGLDIGPKTVERYRDVIAGAKTVVWNGPMGVFEIERSRRARSASPRPSPTVQGTTIIGGGDSVAAVTQAGRRRQDDAHLDRRRRLARVPRRPRTAGRQGSPLRRPGLLKDPVFFSADSPSSSVRHSDEPGCHIVNRYEDRVF